MDREYLMTFPQLDHDEINKVLLIAIETSSIMKDNLFQPKLMTLASSDENLTIRNAAIKTLEKSYNRIL